jgi:hypothetical protein
MPLAIGGNMLVSLIGHSMETEPHQDLVVVIVVVIDFQGVVIGQSAV